MTASMVARWIPLTPIIFPDSLSIDVAYASIDVLFTIASIVFVMPGGRL